jgi:hypothetical protein
MESSSIVAPRVQRSEMRTKNSFLEYYKSILEKVSFDYQLFSKEYRKASNVLSPEETAALNSWIRSKQFDA